MELIETTNWGITSRRWSPSRPATKAARGSRCALLAATARGPRSTRTGKVGPRIKDLPLCKRCEKKAAEIDG